MTYMKESHQPCQKPPESIPITASTLHKRDGSLYPVMISLFFFIAYCDCQHSSVVFSFK